MVPALTIARSLRRQNCRIDVASHIAQPICRYSRAVDETHTYPDPLSDEPGFISWLVAHTRATPYDLVIPVTERSLVPASRQRDAFAHVQLAMPSRRSLDLVLDKEQTVALARQVEVPVPGGVAVASLDELAGCLPGLKYPVVIKPARSLGSNEHGLSQLKVSYAFDEIEVLAGCEHALRFGPVLLQEYFRGEGVGIELIARQGEVAYAFQHLRLHEVPLTGGGSSLRKSVPIEPVLLAASERLIAALEWNGVAMVEFKWNAADKSFTLMEINGRFWGSLPLASAAGADFPAMLLELELEGKVSPAKPYKEDVYCRKLSSDLYWYEAVLRGGEDPRIVKLPGRRQILRELGLFLSPRHNCDVQSLCDPVPGIVDIGAIISSYARRGTSQIADKLFLRRQKKAWRSGDVSRALANSQRILFICYGNINRSALADLLTRGYAEDVGVSVVSAGFHPVDGRCADPVMVEVAADYGYDLTASRSTTLTPELLRDSDVIFAMEKSHIDRLQEIDASALEKTWLLGAHSRRERSGAEIGDPYGRSRENYEHCYSRVASAVDQIKSVLAFRQQG
jgi:protein-tyrosine-phosphatase/predicted ATP-grasp superfamily ATP-dependent carboligase